MVNGGRLVRPHVVQAIGEEEISTAPAVAVLDPTLSPTLVGMMGHVVTAVPFYRDRTLIRGYDVGGKTGTAQIWDAKKGAWKHLLYNYTFVGYVGRESGRPDLVVAVQIHEARPTVAKIGQLEMPVMSFELFRRIAHNAITTPGLLASRRPDEPTGSGAPVVPEDGPVDAAADR
jgi:cell division protein FtsI/penicillin-binding protein 2